MGLDNLHLVPPLLQYLESSLSLFYNWKSKQFGCGGAVKLWGLKNDSPNELITEVFAGLGFKCAGASAACTITIPNDSLKGEISYSTCCKFN